MNPLLCGDCILERVDGVAIRTDFRSLSESFLGEDKIFIGTVDYVDYDTAFIPENNIFSPYLHKRNSFEPEKEVRALTQEIPRRDGMSDMSQDLYVVGKYQPSGPLRIDFRSRCRSIRGGMVS